MDGQHLVLRNTPQVQRGRGSACNGEMGLDSMRIIVSISLPVSQVEGGDIQPLEFLVLALDDLNQVAVLFADDIHHAKGIRVQGVTGGGGRPAVGGQVGQA